MAAPQFLLKPIHSEINDNHPITQGLVFDSPFFEGAGQITEEDAGPLGLEVLGTLNGVVWNKNFYGTDLDFSGAADAVNYTLPASCNSLAKLSLETLVYTRSSGGGTNGRIFYKGAPTPLYFMLFYNSGIGFRSFYATTAGDWNYTGGNFGFNAWYHIIVTYSNSALSNVPVLYINGVNTAWSNSTQPVGAQNADTTSLYIGNNDTATRNHDGKISYARMWNRILTPNEVWALYTNPWIIYKKQNFNNYFNSNPIISSFPWLNNSISQPLNFDSAISV